MSIFCANWISPKLRLELFKYELLAEHPERGEFSCAGRVHLAGSGRGGPVVDDTDDLIDGERDDAEHEMAFDLERAADGGEIWRRTPLFSVRALTRSAMAGGNRRSGRRSRACG